MLPPAVLHPPAWLARPPRQQSVLCIDCSFALPPDPLAALTPSRPWGGAPLARPSQRASEGPHLAASRTTSAPTSSSLAPRRISFARISEPLEVPDLLALQTASFKWLIGNDEWRASAEPGALSGPEGALQETRPVPDFSP